MPKPRKKEKAMAQPAVIQPTPERLAHAAGEYHTQDAVADEGRAHLAGGKPQITVVTDWPIKMLHDRCLLGGPRKDEELNDARHQAAERLYAHWYNGRLNPLGSRDYRQPYSGAGTGFALMPATERQAYHREAWRKAIMALCTPNDRVALVTIQVVIDECPVVLVGQRITGRAQEQQARAVATEYLIDGLDRLRVHFGPSA
jgi:hypothetical protein